MVVRTAIVLGIGVLLMTGCGPAVDEGEPTVTGPSLPDEVVGWTAAGDVESYDAETIYGYIDGHAEVYMAYGFQRCLSRRYTASEEGDEIVVDLFEMASPADAFGVFSHDRAGEPVAVGQGAIYRYGWLSFWSGSWSGSVYATGEGESVREAVLAVAEAAAANLPADGSIPEIVGALPEEGLDPATVTFLRSPQILNAHVVVGPDNPFALGPECQAVVGEYPAEGGASHLLIVRYPDERAAVAVEERLSEAGSTGPAMVIGREGRRIAAVIGDTEGSRAEALLAEALGGDE